MLCPPRFILVGVCCGRCSQETREEHTRQCQLDKEVIKWELIWVAGCSGRCGGFWRVVVGPARIGEGGFEC